MKHILKRLSCCALVSVMVLSSLPACTSGPKDPASGTTAISTEAQSGSVAAPDSSEATTPETSSEAPSTSAPAATVPAVSSSAAETASDAPSTTAAEPGTEAATAPTQTTAAVTQAESTAAAPETLPSVAYTGYITGSNVRVRSSADSSSGANIITSLNRGAEVQCAGTSGSWTTVIYDGKVAYISAKYISKEPLPEETTAAQVEPGKDRDYGDGEQIGLSSSYKYAEFSVINSGKAVYYRAQNNRKGITVCVNAGHGTSGVGGKKILCHPDGSPKVTGGTTGAGATKAVAVSSGMEFNDGTAESKVTLALALKLKPLLLDAGYDVLMIRETKDVQLDNIARTVIANNNADCHIALHWDSTSSDKGAFYMSVPDVRSYRNMEPVASHWREHEALGQALIDGLRDAGVKIYKSGKLEMDLTQTSFSTIPSVDVELGDQASSHSDAALDKLARGLLKGIDRFFS